MFIPGVTGEPSDSDQPEEGGLPTPPPPPPVASDEAGEPGGDGAPGGEADGPADVLAAGAGAAAADVPPPPPVPAEDELPPPLGEIDEKPPVVGPVGSASFAAAVAPAVSARPGGGPTAAELAPAAAASASGPRIGGAGFISLLTLLALIVGGALLWSEGTLDGASASSDAADARRVPAWTETFEQGFARAAVEKKPVVLFFTADWCGPCRQLKKGALSDPMVQELLETEFVAIKVDLTDPDSPNNFVARQNGVRGIPDMRVYRHDGTQVADDIVARSPQQLAGNLAAARRKAR